MMAPPDAKGGKPPPKREFVPIPDRYQDVKTSGLATTVERGETKYDLELKK